ncbi:AzlC family ABC transporter permease, partial [Streptomyces sp. NPDC002586]
MRSLQRTDASVDDASLVRDSSLVWLASGIVGISFGAVSVAGGLPVWVPVVMSLVVYAGSAQFSAVGVLIAGGGPVAAAATGLLLNTRTAAFSLAVAEILGPGRAARFLGAHLVTDETVAFALTQPDPVRRRRAFWISGLGLFAAWNVCVAGGAMAQAVVDGVARRLRDFAGSARARPDAEEPDTG